MGIGETDWLAEEYRLEGRTITPEAARRLAKEHLLDCDSKQVKMEHHDDCAADRLKKDSRRNASRDQKPQWKPAGNGKEVYQKSTGLVDTLLRLLFHYK